MDDDNAQDGCRAQCAPNMTGQEFFLSSGSVTAVSDEDSIIEELLSKKAAIAQCEPASAARS
jgi:hypothetical protein